MANKKKYDEKQQEVIRFNEGHALVLGAPGCGKTDILAMRVLFSHQIYKMDYKDMLCLTFTNRASREMKERIRLMAGDVLGDLFVGNLHRFCIRFLFENNLIPIDTGIADDTDQEEIIAEILGITSPSAKAISTICKVASNIFMMNHDFPDSVRNRIQVNRYDIQNANAYIKYKEDNKLIDFDDILLLAYEALSSPNHREYLYSSYKWIQVDEVQDLNPLQLAIVEKLVADDYASVVYLGDERQAIYSFIGARQNSIRELKMKAGNNFIVLSNNYRSPMYLLDMLNSYAVYQLGVDAQLLPKTNNTTHLDDGLTLVKCYYDLEQYNVIASLSRFLYYNELDEVEKGKKKEEDIDSIGILVRTNKDADEISSNLESHKIKHIKLSKKDSFKMVNFKTVYSHFSVVINDTRFSDWTTILHRTRCVETLKNARIQMKRLREIGLTPADLLVYDQSSYFIEFCESYRNKEIVLFDTETTGLDIYNDDIIQIAAMKMKNGVMVSGSELDIIIKKDEDKTIPPTLKDGQINPMVEEYERRSTGPQGKNQYFMTAQEAFSFFISYIGDDELLGHNSSFDVHILENNIKRRSSGIQFVSRVFWDTLKMSRLLDPNLRKHNLESLLEIYGLEGQNSHNALDDIRATKSLADYCYSKMNEMCYSQRALLTDPEIMAIQRRLRRNYLPFYRHTLDKLYSDRVDDEHTFDYEFNFIYNELVAKKYIEPIKTFTYMRELFSKAVIDPKKDLFFNQQLVNHLYEFRTFNEGDFFQNGIIREKVFIMTIHKAKGLEFDDVIIYDVSYGSMPKSFSRDPDEDARVLYVGMSRAKKRLIMTYQNNISIFICQHPEIMEHFVEMSEEKKKMLLNLEDRIRRIDKK